MREIEEDVESVFQPLRNQVNDMREVAKLKRKESNILIREAELLECEYMNLRDGLNKCMKVLQQSLEAKS